MAELKDRDLVRLYWPVELRPAFDALFAIDEAMGDIVVKANEPALAAIKLAWWRERLEELDEGKVPAEPRLRAAADELLTRSIAGASLARLEDSWAAMLAEESEQVPDRIVARGVRLFEMASSLIGVADQMIEAAGRLYALASIGHRPTVSAELARHRFPRALRPLTALAALAARDARRGSTEPQATPGRAWALLRHRLTGRMS